MKVLTNKEQRTRRHKRIRTRIMGTALCPRLAVFRSNAYLYAQLIDDDAGTTLAAASDLKIAKGTSKMSKLARASNVGELIAEAAQVKNIQKVVFDRGGFLFTGRVKACAEGARKGGLNF